MRIPTKVILPNKKVPFVQNFCIEGTTKENKENREKICKLLERIANFALDEQTVRNAKNNVNVFFRIEYPGTKYIVLTIKNDAKHNPYFAVVDIAHPNNKPQYQVDTDTLIPLLNAEVETAFRMKIAKSFDSEITLTRFVNQIYDYIEEYDNQMEIEKR